VCFVSVRFVCVLFFSVTSRLLGEMPPSTWRIRTILSPNSCHQKIQDSLFFGEIHVEESSYESVIPSK
jgi:hypothetical protein